jgi:hypothetical protein
MKNIKRLGCVLGVLLVAGMALPAAVHLPNLDIVGGADAPAAQNCTATNLADDGCAQNPGSDLFCWETDVYDSCMMSSSSQSLDVLCGKESGKKACAVGGCVRRRHDVILEPQTKCTPVKNPNAR